MGAETPETPDVETEAQPVEGDQPADQPDHEEDEETAALQPETGQLQQ